MVRPFAGEDRAQARPHGCQASMDVRTDRRPAATRDLAGADLQCGVTGVRLHVLRHFAATQVLAAGVPIKTASGRLGHANAATTLNVYAHVLESSDTAAAGARAGLLIAARSDPAGIANAPSPGL